MTLPRVPLQPDRLRNLRWSLPTEFGFARDRLFVPLIHTEILRAAREYPIAMAPDEAGGWTPVAYLGDAAGAANRFVDGSGRWTAAYIPFWLRVHPFVRDGGAFAVVLDSGFVGVAGTHAFEDGDALSRETLDVAAQLARAEAGRGQIMQAATALVEGGVASHRIEVASASAALASAALAFVPAGRPAEVIGPRTAEWMARGSRMVELAVASAFSSAFMPRTAPATLTLDPPSPGAVGRLPPAAQLYVPTLAPADLDWLDMDEKMLF